MVPSAAGSALEILGVSLKGKVLASEEDNGGISAGNYFHHDFLESTSACMNCAA